MSRDVQVIPLPFDRSGVRRFLDMALEVYPPDSLWVAPLFIDALENLSPRNPFYDHAEIALWVARRDGRDVGRIAALHDRRYRPPWNQPTAFFGLFECLPDPAVSAALFHQVHEWARARKLQRVLGPLTSATTNECGLLVRGFEQSPTIMTPYNPPYYADLIEAAGYRKAKDLLAFDFGLSQNPMERLERVARRFRQRNPNLRIRPVTRRSLSADLPLIKRICNEGWEDNWGFTPMTDAEIDFIAGRLKPMLTEGLVWLAEEDGEPAGALIAMLDFNQAIKPLRGRLLHPGILRALTYLLNFRHPPHARVLMLGIRPAFRRRGIESVLLFEGLQAARRLRLRSAEASWILEDNLPVQQTIAHQGGTPSKIYRLYDRAVD